MTDAPTRAGLGRKGAGSAVSREAGGQPVNRHPARRAAFASARRVGDTDRRKHRSRLLDDAVLRRLGGQPGRAPERVAGGDRRPGPRCDGRVAARRHRRPGGRRAQGRAGRGQPTLVGLGIADPGDATDGPQRCLRHHRDSGGLHRLPPRCIRPGTGPHREADRAAADQSPIGVHRCGPRHRRGPAGPPRGVTRCRPRAVGRRRQGGPPGGCRCQRRQPPHGDDDGLPSGAPEFGARAQRLLHLAAGHHVRVPRRHPRELHGRCCARLRHHRDRAEVASEYAGRHQPLADTARQVVHRPRSSCRS